MKLYESITKSLKENEWEDALRSGKVINVSNKAKNYAPADFKYADDKVYYRSGALTGNNWTEHPKNLEDILKHFDNQANEEGATITITNDTEPTIDMNKVIDNDMSIKELDDTAQWLYDNNRDEWDKFTDNELRELANLCHTGKWGRAYDDEVFDEMSRRGITLQESNLKEMENSEGLTNIQFVEYCKDKLADLGTVKVKNFDDEEVDVKVAFEQPIRDYGMCKVLDGEDTMDKLDSDGETLEFVDERGEYHNSPMISPITLVGRCEFDKIDNNFYKSIIQYWDEISDFFESEEINEYQAEVDKCIDAYNNKDLDTAYKAWCQLHEILDNKLDAAGPKDEERFPLYKEWQTYIDMIPKDMMYEITDYGKNKIYAEEYGLKEADGSRLLGGRYRTMSELRDLFKEYADHFETKGNRIKGNTPEDSYNRGWELGKADAYKLAAFEIENNVDPSLLREADNMNTTTSFIDIKEIIKYAENYLMEKLNATASIVIRPDGQYTLTIPNTDKAVADYLKLHNDLHLWEADLGYKEKLGGDPEDYISDIQSIKDKLNELDTDKFATKLAYEVWEQFDDTCDYQIQSTKDRFLNESYNYIGKDTGEAGRNDKSHMEHIYTVYDCFGEVDTFQSKEDAEKYIEEHKDDEMYTEEYGCSNGPEFRIDEDDIEVNNKKIVIKDDLKESEEKKLAVESWTFTE